MLFSILFNLFLEEGGHESLPSMQPRLDEDGNRNWSKLTKNGAFVRETEYIGNMEHVKTKSGDEYFVYLGDNLMYHYNEHIGECFIFAPITLEASLYH